MRFSNFCYLQCNLVTAITRLVYFFSSWIIMKFCIVNISIFLNSFSELQVFFCKFSSSYASKKHHPKFQTCIFIFLNCLTAICPKEYTLDTYIRRHFLSIVMINSNSAYPAKMQIANLSNNDYTSVLASDSIIPILFRL